ncbi:MAG: NYN domain-containing protein [Armatimonadota bacterium]
MVSIASPRLKTCVYIDGFNLYYGLYKHPAPANWKYCKWLDLERFCDQLLPHNDVVSIKYYTAIVRNMPPDYQQKRRQLRYLKALRTLPRVEVILGHFIGPNPRRMHRCDSDGHPCGYNVYVLKTEEKGSDVNLAVDLLHDGVRKLYQCAVVISNDSDLARAIKIARYEYNRTIGIVNPHKHHKPMSHDLALLKHFERTITAGTLAASQLPDQVVTPSGPVSRPTEWALPAPPPASAP